MCVLALSAANGTDTAVVQHSPKFDVK